MKGNVNKYEKQRVCEKKKKKKKRKRYHISLTSHLFWLVLCVNSHDSSCTLIGCRQTEPLPLAARRLLLIGLLFTLISLALAIACRPTQNRNSAHTLHAGTDSTAPLVVKIHNSDNWTKTKHPIDNMHTDTVNIRFFFNYMLSR